MADERSNAAHLAARLIDARLALPLDCRMILVLSRMEDQDQANNLRRDFNLVVTSGDQALGTFLRDPRDLGAAKMPDRSTKEVAVRRFDAALRTSQRVFREARARSRQEHMSKSFGSSTFLRRQVAAPFPKHSDYVYRPRNRFETPAGPISLLEAARRPGLARQLRSAVDAHLLESWILDTGVPFPPVVRDPLGCGRARTRATASAREPTYRSGLCRGRGEPDGAGRRSRVRDADSQAGRI